MYVVGFALVFWVVASAIGLVVPHAGVLEVIALIGGGIVGWRRAQRRGEAIEAGVGETRSLMELPGVLLLHGFGALIWFAFLGFSSDYAGTDRQFQAATAFGLVTWLAATALIVWLWRSGRSPFLFWSTPFAWWGPSFLVMIAIVYGW